MRVLLCDCGGTVPLDEASTGDLCRSQVDRFRAALSEGGRLLLACRQETALFDELRAEMAPDVEVVYADIRDRAGWSDEGAQAGPKIAALLADAATPMPGAAAVPFRSEGAVLVIGRDEAALAAARRLSPRLPVSLLLVGDAVPDMGSLDDVPVSRGTIRAAAGHLGAFELVVDGLAARLPAGRGPARFGAARNGVTLAADILIDLGGGQPMFSDHWRRDGYLRPDPGDPAAVQRALFDAAGLVGEFEKPRFIAVRPELCAHSRSNKPGCTRCLDVCPTGAAGPDGAAVAIDPHVCAGCGSCAAACPTGALAYQLPPDATLLARLATLLATYGERGGRDPVLLVHEEDGYDVLAAAARYGRGLPARVLPFAVNEVTQLGFDHLTAAGLGYGGGRARLIEAEDPDELVATLYGLTPRPVVPGDFRPAGERRGSLRLALSHLHAQAPAPADAVALPAGAPFGDVRLDLAKCTLCMACTEGCPSRALRASPTRPQLSFIEQSCVQCGLCRAICPESAVTLVPRLSFTAEGRAPRVLKEGEAARCIRCDKPFATAAVVERMAAALADQHPMFMGDDARRLRMCEDCRVIDQVETADDPMAGPPRPRPRTTEDDLRERERQHEQTRH
ncbi:MAG: 4Fe-4S binding protein [Magnetospirillum sp.]|nr:4Fe-4S binding protein [Magnetospirillum sp.]